jgi:hypothetical protein
MFRKKIKQPIVVSNSKPYTRRYYGSDEAIVYLLSLDKNMSVNAAYQLMNDARIALFSNSERKYIKNESQSYVKNILFKEDDLSEYDDLLL